MAESKVGWVQDEHATPESEEDTGTSLKGSHNVVIKINNDRNHYNPQNKRNSMRPRG